MIYFLNTNEFEITILKTKGKIFYDFYFMKVFFYFNLVI